MLYGAMKNMGVYFTSRPIHLRKSFSEKLKMEKQFVHKWYLGQIWLLKIARVKYKCVNVSTWQTNQKKNLKI